MSDNPGYEPDVVKVLRQFRESLALNETFVMERMADTWVVIERQLQKDIMLLAEEIVRRQQAGEVITQQILWRMERYRELQAQISVQIRRYGPTALGAIDTSQQSMAALGIQAAQEAIHASYGVTTGVRFNRINVRALESMIGYLADGTPLTGLLAELEETAANGVERALINGVARGLNPYQMAGDMADGMGLGLDRAVLIARTESARAYRAGSQEQYQRSSVVEGMMRLVKKETACMACLMRDGEFIPVGGSLDDHPAGKCIAVPKVRGVNAPSWQSGQEYFLSLDPAEQRERMGEERYALWQNGGFELEQLAQTSHSDVWGDAPRVATMAELIAGAAQSVP